MWKMPAIASFLLLNALGQEPVGSVEIQQLRSGSDASLRGVSAVDAQTVWISGAGGFVARTLDGGATFSMISVPGGVDLDFRDVQAFAGNRAVLLSAGPGEASRIYASQDGGETWSLAFKNQHPQGFLNSLAFWDSDRGIAVGDPVDGRLMVLLTSDGGRSWSSIPGDQLPAVREGEYGFAASGSNVAVQGADRVWIGTGGAAARVFRSLNRGLNWEAFETPIASGTPSSGIFSLAFRDEEQGIAVGGDYQLPEAATGGVALSKDGGRSWRLIEDAASVPFRSAVGHWSGDLWLAVGSSGISLSVDNGASWRPTGDAGYNALSIAGQAWLVGSGGRVAAASAPH